MRIQKVERRQFIPRDIEEVFAFFARAENLQQITPAWLDFRILSVTPPRLQKGALIRYRLTWHDLIPLLWTTRITQWNPPFSFVDEQISGPYKLWHHEHRFERQGTGTLMFDTVRYALPLGILGSIAHRFIVRRDIERIFDFREDTIRDLFTGERGSRG